jgi:hypothetical protein
MRNSIIAIIIGIAISSITTAQENIKFPIKSGIIKYNSTGLSVGTSVLYFDNYGSILCEDFTGTIWEQNIKTRTIAKDSNIYILDMLEKTFTVEKMTIAGQKLYDEFYFNEKNFVENGFRKEGEELVIGKNCYIYSSTNGPLIRLWVWKSLILKKEDDLLGGSILYATSLQELSDNIKIFEVSADYKKQ